MSKKKTGSSFLRGFVWGGSLTLTAAISGIIGMTIALKSPLPVDFTEVAERIIGVRDFGLGSLWQKSLNQSVNILVMGVDVEPNTSPNSPQRFNGRSDTMLLVRLEPEDNSLRMLSIPRDSRVRFPNGHFDKINGANAIGGVQFTQQVLQQNFNGVSVDKYVRVTTDAFRELVDAVGGVNVYVPTDMKYTDHTQGLFIDLKEGQQLLNGDQAEQFVRWRGDNLGDIGRVQRQQILLQALRQRLQSPQMVFKIPQLLRVIENNVDTNLTNRELFSFLSFGMGLNSEDVRMVLLPGRPSTPQEFRLSYWLISENEKNQVMEQYLSVNSSEQSQRRALNQINIVIENATSEREFGRAIARRLQEAGYSRIQMSQSSLIPTNKTKIIPQRGDYESAQRIQAILDFAEIEASSTGNLQSDITIRIGRDAREIK